MNKYLENAEKVLKAAKSRTGLIDHPCHTCRYCRPASFRSKCVNPIVLVATTTVSSRGSAEYLSDTQEQRSDSSMFGPVVCGPNGALWEAKPPRWERFKARISKND